MNYAGDVAERMREIHDEIRAQQHKRPRVNAQGHPLPWRQQDDAYRAVVDQATHERAHGDGTPRDHAFTRDHG